VRSFEDLRNAVERNTHSRARKEVLL